MFWALLVLAQAGEAVYPCPAGTGEPVAVNDSRLSHLKVIRKVIPQIPSQARPGGTPPSILALRIVVPENGPSCNIRVISTIGFGLDEAAIAAVRQWEFQPGVLGGKQVAVELPIEIAFFIESAWIDPDEFRRREFNIALNAIIAGDPKAERAAAKMNWRN